MKTQRYLERLQRVIVCEGVGVCGDWIRKNISAEQVSSHVSRFSSGIFLLGDF